MDDPIFKSKYQKYKYKVKLWEKDFKEKNGRIPSKYDIREAPTTIRDSYKMYYKLKTSFLEETLSDALEDDSFDLSILESSNQTDIGGSFSISDVSTVDISQLTNSTLTILTDMPNNSSTASASTEVVLEKTLAEPNLQRSNTWDEGKMNREFEAEKYEELNDKAWGNHLNNQVKHGPSDDKDSERSARVRQTMSDKLFRNSSFSKRNPRKSMSTLSLRSSYSFSSISESQKESLPDLETILSQKSQHGDNEMIVMTNKSLVSSNTGNIHSTIENQINKEWLNRCNEANSLGETGVSAVNSQLDRNSQHKSTEEKPKYGLSNISVRAFSSSTIIPAPPIVDNKSMQSSSAFATENKYGFSDDDDDEIAGSEDENSTNNSEPKIRSIRHVMKKRKLDELSANNQILDSVNKETTNSIEVQPNINVPQLKKEPVAKKGKKVKKVVKAKKQVQPVIERRRSCRIVNTVKESSYKLESDSSNEADPFAADDTDDDPDFGSDKKGQTKPTIEISASCESSDESDKLKEKPIKTIRKRVVKTMKQAVTKRAGKLKTLNAKKSKTGNNTDVTIQDEETPDDYQIEFGLDKLKSAPRIDITELEQTTEVFSEYVVKQTTMASAPVRRGESSGGHVAPITKQSIAREKLEKRIASGKLNENFVRINLQKKVYVRGKKVTNFSKYKKSQWRQKKAAALAGPDMDMGGCDGGLLICFQCGLPGHFAQNCKMKSDRLLPLDADVEVSPFPTLDEIEKISNEQSKLVHGHRTMPAVSNPMWKENNDGEMTESLDEEEVDVASDVPDENIPSDATTEAQNSTYIGHIIPEDFLIKAGLLNDSTDDKEIKPLYNLNEDGTLQTTPQEVFDALHMFGHTQFRPGQEKAVMRILSGQSSLVTLSTGSGKSLCYQLPAYLYCQKRKCITLVVSPLVSLMEDQVHGVPDFLNAQCLHTNQPKEKRQKILDSIKSGNVHVLLVSPEAIVAGEKSSGFGSILRELPPIAFVCIDEAHCVSQWSHNFRPSYLMVCKVLHETLNVRTILGLTATATLATRQSIVSHLRITDGLSGVISDIPLPDNLTLTVSCDENRDAALVHLLKHNKFTNYSSIIVYCTRRDECESVAKNLRTVFQDKVLEQTDSKKRKRGIRAIVEPYHAGLPASKRKSVQNAFMRGDLKIVVATIAFGMGINKADIRAVIHYNMPNNFERYVQEVGRAGRDGDRSHCHLFLDSRGNDKMELRRHIFANSIDRHVIRKLLEKVFIPCACKKNMGRPEMKAYQSDIDAVQSMIWSDDMDTPMTEATKARVCPGHEVCFSIDATVNELDIPEENIATLLCYLELHEKQYVKTLSKAFTICKVLSYGGPKELRVAAQSCPPLAMAIALDLKKGKTHEKSTFIEFPVIDIASAIGWNSGVVKYQLKNLEWTTVNNAPKRSTISVTFTDLGFRIRAPGDFSDDELDETLDMLYSRVKNQEKTQLIQLENVFKGLTSVAKKSCISCVDAESHDENSEKLKRLVRDYFQSDETKIDIDLDDQNISNQMPESQIICDIRTMIVRYPENNFTGRSLARIFHGVSSPVYPAAIWGRCKYWRAHIKNDFNGIVSLANAEIIRMRT